MEKLDKWKYRRRIVFGTTIATMSLIVYIAIAGSDTALASTIVNSGFLFMGGIVLTYLGGCAAEHFIDKRKKEK